MSADRTNGSELRGALRDDTIAAARDPRVTRLWIAHGGGRPYLMIETGLRRDVPNALLRGPLAALGTVLVSGPRFAPERWVARVAPRPIVMLNATEDERIPPTSVQALSGSAQPPLRNRSGSMAPTFSGAARRSWRRSSTR